MISAESGPVIVLSCRFMHIAHNRKYFVSDCNARKKYADCSILFTAHQSSGSRMTQMLSTCTLTSGRAAGQ